MDQSPEKKNSVASRQPYSSLIVCLALDMIYGVNTLCSKNILAEISAFSLMGLLERNRGQI